MLYILVFLDAVGLPTPQVSATHKAFLHHLIQTFALYRLTAVSANLMGGRIKPWNDKLIEANSHHSHTPKKSDKIESGKGGCVY